MALKPVWYPAIWLLLASAGASAGDHVLLNATFDHETVDALVGTGGPTVGEPISLFCHGDSRPNDCATIATTPFATPNLQLRDTDTYYGSDIRFEFLGSEEVTTGTVQIRMQVLFTGSGQPEIGLREQGTAALSFLDFYAGDGNPYLGAYTGNTFHGGIGQYTANIIVPLEIDASADQKLVQSKTAVEIETLRAQAEVEPLKALADQLRELRQSGPDSLPAYVRNVRLKLFSEARRAILEVNNG